MALTLFQSLFLVYTTVEQIAQANVFEGRWWGQGSFVCKQQKMLCIEQWEADLCQTNKQSLLEFCNTKQC